MIAVRVIGVSMVLVLALVGGRALAWTEERSCPAGAIAIEPGASIQAAVDRAGAGAVLCLKNGIHRAQAVRPRARQHFVGEGHTVLNGSNLVTGFRREGRYWVAANPFQPGRQHGECLPSAPTCDRPQTLFIDNRPLVKAQSRRAVTHGQFYIDYDGDPTTGDGDAMGGGAVGFSW